MDIKYNFNHDIETEKVYSDHNLSIPFNSELTEKIDDYEHDSENSSNSN